MVVEPVVGKMGCSGLPELILFFFYSKHSVDEVQVALFLPVRVFLAYPFIGEREGIFGVVRLVIANTLPGWSVGTRSPWG